MVEFTHSLTPVLPALLGRVRALFDLDARPDVIARRLRQGRAPGAAVKANPGLRVPGAFNGFEMGLRAILGQQVTVKAATTIAGRFVEAFGEPIVTPFAELNRLTPAPTRVAAASVDDIARHGIVAARARSIIALAQAQGSGELCLDGGAHHNPDDSIKRLARAARDRSVDRALHRHARAALARCVPEGRHRGAQQSRWRDGERGRSVVPTVAAVAELCGHARLAHCGEPMSSCNRLGAGDRTQIKTCACRHSDRRNNRYEFGWLPSIRRCWYTEAGCVRVTDEKTDIQKATGRTDAMRTPKACPTTWAGSRCAPSMGRTSTSS